MTNEEIENTFSELVGESLGRASMAWSETPKGIFDSDACSVLHIDIMNAHNKELSELREENKKIMDANQGLAIELESIQSKHKEAVKDLKEAVKVLQEGCVVYDQKVPPGSSSFRVEADMLIQEMRKKHGLE